MANLSAADLVDMGVCPTCYDKANGGCIYGDQTERILFENDHFVCLLISNPRTAGHSIISTKQHYKDMMELPDELCREIFSFARQAMIAIKAIYQAESVYLCTMCDGPMNHFHLQMIPRYSNEPRGSANFVKKRCDYVHDPYIVNQLRKSFAGI